MRGKLAVAAVMHDGRIGLVEHIEKHWCPTTTSNDLAALLKG